MTCSFAAHSRALGLRLVTNNTTEFERVNLKLDNWTLPALFIERNRLDTGQKRSEGRLILRAPCRWTTSACPSSRRLNC
jgi:hypothetical protein